MRIVIKPAGLFMLIAVLATLSVIAFFGLPRGARTPAASAPPPAAATPAPVAAAVSGDLLAGQAWELTVSEPGAAEMTPRTDAVPGVGEPTRVYAVSMDKSVKDPWAISFRVSTPAPLTKGEKLRLVFRARSKGAAPFIANFEQNGEPYAKSVAQTISTTPEWKQYTVAFAAQDDYAPQKSQATFHCGMKTGSLEFADLHLFRAAK